MTLVVTRLIGGLGNQMFQYAAGRAIADRHNAELLVDISDFKTYSLRRYELNALTIRAKMATSNELASLKPLFPIDNRLARGLNRVITALRPASALRIYTEQTFAYDEVLRTLQLPLYMNGYWQSERYFSEFATRIREDFNLKLPLDTTCQHLLEQVRRVSSISLHVRRGDYVSNTTTAKIHGTCSLGYYRTAIDYVASQVKDPYFFIFSDDLDWVAKNLHLEYPKIMVNINGPDRGVIDMALMKECKHHIIANSSFSWWGAWLNPSREKIVIAPRQWFNQSHHDTRDLLPAGWVKL